MSNGVTEEQKAFNEGLATGGPQPPEAEKPSDPNKIIDELLAKLDERMPSKAEADEIRADVYKRLGREDEVDESKKQEEAAAEEPKWKPGFKPSEETLASKEEQEALAPPKAEEPTPAPEAPPAPTPEEQPQPS